MRVNMVDVEIPKEMSQFDELNTLVGHDGHNARLIASITYRAAEWRKTDLYRVGEAKPKQRSTTARRRKKTNPSRRSANEEMEDKVVDLISLKCK